MNGEGGIVPSLGWTVNIVRRWAFWILPDAQAETITKAIAAVERSMRIVRGIGGERATAHAAGR